MAETSKYIVRYWVSNLAKITGLENGDEITEDQLLELIRGQKVNVMVHHAPAYDDTPAISYCHIDDIKHMFQQR